MLPTILDLSTLRDLYASGRATPVTVAEAVAERMEASTDPAIFITALDREALVSAARDLMARHPEPNSLPLWGVPFAVKDNIDVAGLPTTAACPAFAYTAEADAEVVARLKAAGALCTGKTNLDQFATGLNGTRSPYGAPRSVFSAAHVSGGSSSGSAVAVAAGLASFSLGTDTAGSGRVPAMFNNLVGIKPTPGLFSTTGLVPACRSLDCISIFAATVGDGLAIRRIAEGFDAADPFSRRAVPHPLPAQGLRFGVPTPAEREFYGDAEREALYDAAIARLEALGAVAVPFDYAPFREIATLLYNGPWVAERLAAIAGFFAGNADALDPSVRSIVESAKGYSAVDAFEGRYAFEALRRSTEATWAAVDILLLPTSPTTYTVEEMLADPIRLNSHFGHYTNFANLLGLAAIAVPGGFGADGLPGGVTLVGPGFSDEALGPWADALHRAAASGMGIARDAVLPEASRVSATETDEIAIAVVGAHLTGLPLNHQLTDLGGRKVRAARTSGAYRLYALPGTHPAKPGLVHEPGLAGGGLEVEIWALPPAGFGRFTAAIPAPLGIGKLTLEDGSDVSGFLCEAHAVAGAEDITIHGGWRAYLASR
ncbi:MULTISPECIES: allophanate hydrolase [unclassified Methylobacterium]|uniref:allophanate hydrolase n=1 Tax=unclassified Methylobacterium TaxID=2615210 RepID=UPI000700DE08|nr:MULTISPECIES: allophanate hydrolase [unclassified Methylobacterium]KQO57912.1 allophanate hydrolase [Methylobacterium sp. Leaf86]KQO85639.1 allophanate hydrolase [Methylobacterium sp. Leaf91]